MKGESPGESYVLTTSPMFFDILACPIGMLWHNTFRLSSPYCIHCICAGSGGPVIMGMLSGESVPLPPCPMFF